MLTCVTSPGVSHFKNLLSSLEKMDAVLQRHLLKLFKRESTERIKETVEKGVKSERIKFDGNVISYIHDGSDRVGIFVSPEPLQKMKNYFEIEIIDGGELCNISLGLVPNAHQMNEHPGLVPESVGYHSGDGRLYSGSVRGALQIQEQKCEIGDRLGCGVKFESSSPQEQSDVLVQVFFTRNRKEIGCVLCPLPPEGLYPAVGLHSQGEEVQLIRDVFWFNGDEDIMMSVDNNEDDWTRLHDIRLNGSMLEYAGQGKSIVHVGLAQAKYPLTTMSHYFEIEIVDPGKNCYIAIGLARRDYPRYRHPGWNKGSIAYHADDGKLFVGSGVGDMFGPRCYKGDIMGCGIIFPRDYVSHSESESSELTLSSSEEPYNEGSQSDSEDEEWWKAKNNVEDGTVVQVFFTRNGKTIGRKEVGIPKGGFYPTVGMLSNKEKVKVDLHPLTG